MTCPVLYVYIKQSTTYSGHWVPLPGSLRWPASQLLATRSIPHNCQSIHKYTQQTKTRVGESLHVHSYMYIEQSTSGSKLNLGTEFPSKLPFVGQHPNYLAQEVSHTIVKLSITTPSKPKGELGNHCMSILICIQNKAQVDPNLIQAPGAPPRFPSLASIPTFWHTNPTQSSIYPSLHLANQKESWGNHCMSIRICIQNKAQVAPNLFW